MSTEPAGGGARARDARARRAPSKDGLLIVGLVGRAGSGKSTVAKILEAEGAQLIEADALGHRVTDTNLEVRAALRSEYGHDVYRADGTLDRARVAERVFSDRAALERLNRLVHPPIVAAIRSRIDELRSAGFRGVVVVDAALMLDWSLERDCDRVLAVVANEAEQVARLRQSRGWSEAEARARLSAQRTNEAFRAAADATLDNSGSEPELRARVLDVLNAWNPRGGHA